MYAILTFCGWLWVVLGSPARAAPAPGLDTAQSVLDSACVGVGVTSYYTVHQTVGATTAAQEVFVEDTDSDGLPEYAWCVSGSTPTRVALTHSNADCSTTNTTELATTDGCSFAIYVWVGTSGADTVDCGASGMAGAAGGVNAPVMMFGGAGNDASGGPPPTAGLVGGAQGDVIHGGDGADWIKGGDGGDFLCGGNDGDALYGEDGDDFLWAGMGNDKLDGGPGEDVLNGSVGNETNTGSFFTGGDGADVVNGGAGNDEPKGGGSNDHLHGTNGLDSCAGEDGDDTLYTADNTAETTVLGGAGSDTCYSDVNGALYSHADTLNSCTLVGSGSQPCNLTAFFFVGTSPASGSAKFYELDRFGLQEEDGGANNSGLPLDLNGANDYADEILGLAVDPSNCSVYALVDDSGTTKLVTVNLSQGSAATEYAATVKGSVTDDDVIDIAFAPDGTLYGLTSDAHVWKMVKSTGAKVSAGSGGDLGQVGRAHGGTLTGVLMTYDPADAANLLVLTHRDGAGSEDWYDADAVEVKTGRQRNLANHVTWAGTTYPWPVTGSPFGYGGPILTIAEVSGGVYKMWERARPAWGGVTDGGSGVMFDTTDPDRLWTGYTVPGSGQGCDANTGDQCYAELGASETIDAFTMPHYLDMNSNEDPWP